jgi:hypothetical protein
METMKIKQKTKQKFDEKLQKYFLFAEKLLMDDPHLIFISMLFVITSEIKGFSKY